MKTVIVDGNNNFIRQYVANPTLNTNGEPVGGAVGLIRNVKGYLRDFAPDRLVVVWDGEGGSQRRRGIYSEYKAGRKVRLNREFDSEGGPKEDLGNMVGQFELAKKYLKLLGVSQIRVQSVEADDVIAYLCNHVLDEDTKVVITSDHDMYQLVNDRCKIYNPLRKETVQAAQVLEKHGCLPENYILVKALIGDNSDNIDGVKGMGEKTALKLFPFLAKEISSLERIFAEAEYNLESGIGKKPSPKYKTVLEKREMIVQNFELMQLASPIISANATRSIREQLESEVKLSSFNTQLAFKEDGLQIKDIDFFISFREYDMRKRAK